MYGIPFLQKGTGMEKDEAFLFFLNMTSKNGSKELVSLLQYMKKTDINNPEIKVKDERLLMLDKIVEEVRESEEWEAVKLDILDVGINKGIEIGREQGIEQGIKQGMEQTIHATIEFPQEHNIKREDAKRQLAGKLNLSEDQILEYMNKYWK